MLTFDELQRALRGAWLLARGDPQAFAWFDLTVEGFWRSFYAAVVAAPLFLGLAVYEHWHIGWPAGPLTTLAVRTLAYALDWILFPILALLLVRIVDLGHRYVVYIIANNWASVLQLVAFAVSVGLAAFLPEPLDAMLLLTTFVLVVTYRWLVARMALATTGRLATAFVIVDLTLGLLLDQLSRGMLT